MKVHLGSSLLSVTLYSTPRAGGAGRRALHEGLLRVLEPGAGEGGGEGGSFPQVYVSMKRADTASACLTPVVVSKPACCPNKCLSVFGAVCEEIWGRHNVECSLLSKREAFVWL